MRRNWMRLCSIILTVVLCLGDGSAASVLAATNPASPDVIETVTETTEEVSSDTSESLSEEETSTESISEESTVVEPEEQETDNESMDAVAEEVPTDATEEETTDEIEVFYGYNPGEDPYIVGAIDEDMEPVLGDIPASYNTNFESASMPALRDQNPYGTCWAHSAIALAEIYMMNKSPYKSDYQDIDLSELHLASNTYNPSVDPLGGTATDVSSSFVEYLQRGGNIDDATIRVMGWSGLVDESVASYELVRSEGSTMTISSGVRRYASKTVDSSLAFSNNSIAIKNEYVVNIHDNIDYAKKLVMDYGAVSLSYHAEVQGEEGRYYNSTNNSYYCYDQNEDNANHAVTIVGWDDNYSRSNFNSSPSGDGAWLIRNSWTTNDRFKFSNYGYFWLSYYDKSIRTNAYAFEATPYGAADYDYDNNYYYDGGLELGRYNYSSSRNLFANIFDTRACDDGELLKAVEVQFYYPSTDYKINVYKNLTDDKPLSGTLVESATVSGHSTYAGYHTIELNSDVELSKNEKYSVVVEVSSTDDNITASALGVEYNSSTCAGKSFFGYMMGSDEPFLTSCSLDVRIRALTSNIEPSAPGRKTVSFDANCDDAQLDISSISVEEGTAIGELPSCSRPGYEFTGWYTARTGGTNITESTIVSSDITVYAHWEIIEYTVDFILDGGEFVNSKTIPVSTVNHRIPDFASYTVTRDRYNFEGWYTDPLYNSEFDPDVDILSDTTLYALWTPVIERTVLFYPNGDDVTGLDITDLTVDDGDSIGELLPVPSRAGYRFAGWFTDEEAGTEVTSSTPILADTSLYAHWEYVEYTVTFTLNGGYFSPAKPMSVKTVSHRLAEPSSYIPVKAKNNFMGWYVDEECTEAFDPEVDILADITLYAAWEIQPEYTVADPYVVNNETGEVIESGSEVPYGTVIALKTSTAGARILYTLDDSEPIEAGITYSSHIEVTEAVSLKILATKSGYISSNIVDFSLEIASAEDDWGDIAEEDRPSDISQVPQGLWVAGLTNNEDHNEPLSFSYTGKAISPAVRVYFGKRLLTLKKDYTLKYTNNKNAAAYDSTKAPTLTVTGKGDYSGKIVETFTILPITMDSIASDCDFTVDSIVVAFKKGVTQKITPVIRWNGVKLKAGTDYKVQWNDESDPEEGIVAYRTPGDYNVTIIPRGNFEGDGIDVTESIVNIPLMSSATVALAHGSSIKYTDYFEEEPILVVTYNGKKYEEGYSVEFPEEIKVGNNTVTVVGDGEIFAGTKKYTLKITGDKLTAAKLLVDSSCDYAELIAEGGSYVYDGNEHIPAINAAFKMADGELIGLTDGDNCTITYPADGINAGTKTIVITGMGRFTGKVKYTYKILPYNIASGTDDRFGIYELEEQTYVKSGIKPEVTCLDGENILVKGTDYTVTYKNNKKLNTDDSLPIDKLPQVVIKGKGNYKGTTVFTYRINRSDIGLLNDVSANDILYKGKANTNRSAIIIKDTDGTKLALNKDYKNPVYTYYEDSVMKDGTIRTKDTEVLTSDIPRPGTIINVAVEGMGFYEGTSKTATYRIGKVSIASATVKISNQIFTGKAIRPGLSDMTFVLDGKKYTAEEIADVVDIVGYTNNIKKGTATVTLKGKTSSDGTEYFGLKAVKFKILAKSMCCTVTYYANGGRGKALTKTQVMTFLVSKFFTEKQSGFTRAGYYIESWNTSPEGDGDSYGPGDIFLIGTRRGDSVELYAQWSEIEEPDDDLDDDIE